MAASELCSDKEYESGYLAALRCCTVYRNLAELFVDWMARRLPLLGRHNARRQDGRLARSKADDREFGSAAVTSTGDGAGTENESQRLIGDRKRDEFRCEVGEKHGRTRRLRRVLRPTQHQLRDGDERAGDTANNPEIVPFQTDFRGSVPD